MTWAVLIGAGPSQTPYIERLRKRGLSVFATDRDPDAPGLRLADRAAVVSTHDPAGTLAAVASLPPEDVGVVLSPTTGEPLRTLHHVLRALGRPALDESTLDDLLHKGRLRARLNRQRASAIASALARTPSEASDAFARLGGDVVVKPARGGMGGRGVRVARSAGDASALVARMGGAEAVLERRIEGEEFGVTGFVHKGALGAFTVGSAIRDPRGEALVVGRAMGPGAEGVEPAVRRVVASACAGLPDGPVNADVIVAPSGEAHVIEIEFALADALVLSAALGRDLVDDEVASALGFAPAPFSFRRAAAVRWLAHPAPAARRVRGVEAASALPGVVEVLADGPVRSTIAGRNGPLHVWGRVVARGETQTSAIETTSAAERTLQFDYA